MSTVQDNGFVVSMWSYTNHASAVQSLTSLKNQTNATSIEVDFALLTDGYNSHNIAIQYPNTLSKLEDVISIAKNLGLDVWFKPIVEVGTGSNHVDWEHLAPSNPQQWFANYSAVINQLGSILQSDQVSHYLITNELSSMTTNPAYSANWASLISSLKTVYTGQVGFNAGAFWGTGASSNEFANIPAATLQSIDFLGLSAYPRLLGIQSYTDSAVQTAWSHDYYGQNDQAMLQAFYVQHPNLPLYITELGSPAFYGGYLNYNNFTSSSATPDPQSQLAFYQGSLAEIAQNLSFINGTFAYNWTLNTGNASASTSPVTYAWDLYNKPADYSVFKTDWTSISTRYDVGPTQTAGSAYMLYQAAFNRTPDIGGLGYWIAQLDKGANITTAVAQSFINSPEFIAQYGVNPSNATYVNDLYQNVLHRTGDAGGIAYWNQQLNSGAVSKAYVLEQFATLPEGAANVASTIAHGIHYAMYVG